MEILITGAHGFVGTRLMKELEGAIAAPSIQGMNEKQIRQIVEESEADVIIHTAAISDVGICEKNPEESYYANVLLPVYLAKASDGRKLICFSSDQVYRGCESDGPYREDEAKPANIYGAHKLEMEQRVLDRQPDSVLLRAEWMYDYISPRGNYLLNVLNAKETLTFGRQYRGITYLREVCENLERIVKLPENGLQQSGKLSGETVLAETNQVSRMLYCSFRVEFTILEVRQHSPCMRLRRNFCRSQEAGSRYKKVLWCTISGWTAAKLHSTASYLVM